MAKLVQDKGVSALPPVLIKDMLTGETRLANKPVMSTLEGIIKQASKEAAIAGTHALANRPDSQSTPGTITVSTLVIVGVADTIYPPAMATAMKEAIPNATLKIIDGAAHAVVIEKPGRVNKSTPGLGEGGAMVICLAHRSTGYGVPASDQPPPSPSCP